MFKGKSSIRILLILIVVGGAFCLYELRFSIKGHIEQQTCSLCGSIRQVYKVEFLQVPISEKKESLKYKSIEYENCKHHWLLGISLPVKTLVNNEQIVLVYKEGIYGAFRFTLQEVDQNQARIEYDWWYRTDGKSLLDPSDPAVLHGHDVGDPTSLQIGDSSVLFGPFKIEWSRHHNGLGWLYYAHMPFDGIYPKDVSLSGTDLQSPQNLDGADPQWQYNPPRILLSK